MFLGHMGVRGWWERINGTLQAILGFSGRRMFVRRRVPFFLDRHRTAAGPPGTLKTPLPPHFWVAGTD